MAIKLEGTLGAAVAEIEQIFKALRVTQRPNEVLGSFRLAVTPAALLTTIAADAVIFSFRSAPTGLTIIKRISVEFKPIVNFTASQEIGADVVVARAFTSSDTGGTSINSANTPRVRTSLSPSAAADIRITTGTNVALSAGTRTLDANPILIGTDANKLGAGAPGGFVATLDFSNAGMYPLVLAPNEGFVVRNKILGGAGGSVKAVITVDWSEASAF